MGPQALHCAWSAGPMACIATTSAWKRQKVDGLSKLQVLDVLGVRFFEQMFGERDF